MTSTITSAKYRTRIYDTYVTRAKKRKVPEFDVVSAVRWGRSYRSYMRGWLPEHRASRICDVACGSGTLLHFVKSCGYENLAGVDISREQVQVARHVCPGVVEGDVSEYLSARPGEFDLITALDIVEHLDKDDVLRFLENCYGSLKSGGRLVLQTPNADSPWASAIRYGDFTHEVCFNAHSLEWLLRLSGFQQCDARETGPVPCSVGSFGRCLAWQMIRTVLKIWNLAETGSTGSGVFTRVFLISAVKP